MDIYKLSEDEAKILGRYNIAKLVAMDQSRAVEQMMMNWVVDNILPKMKLNRIANIAISINIDLLKNEITFGNEAKEPQIVVPAGTVSPNLKNGEFKGN